MSTNKIIPIKVAYNNLGIKLPVFNNKQKVTNGISIMITKDCNLHCDFCLERYYEKFDQQLQSYSDGMFLQKYNCLVDGNSVEIINQTRDKTLEVIRALNGSELYNLSLLGGELFQDKYKQDIYDAYDDLLQQCIDQIKKQKGKYQWSLMTNLITKNPQRIIDLAIKHKCTINASFDFCGRFKTHKTLDLWLKNIALVKQSQATYVVNVCMSKANIERILANDPLWVQLYNDHVIHLEQYQDVGDDDYTVSSDLLTKLYIHLYQYYPKVANIISEQQFFATCISVFPNVISWQCCDHFAMMKRFFEAKQCLSCEYFDDCELQDCYLVYPDDCDCYIKNFKDWLKVNRQADRDAQIRLEDQFANQEIH